MKIKITNKNFVIVERNTLQDIYMTYMPFVFIFTPNPNPSRK